MKNKKVIIAVLVVVLIAGAIVTYLKGFNFDVNYSRANEIEVQINKEFDIRDVEQIAKDVLGAGVSVSAVEFYNDAVSIKAKEISNESRDEIISKINEKYETEINSQFMAINTIANIRGRDIVKNLVLPFIASTAIVLIYMIIKYFRLGFGKVLLKTIIALVVAQAELFSLIAITRYPVGRTTISLIFFVYVFTLVAITSRFEQQLHEVKAQEED